MHDADDVFVWGRSGVGRREHWPKWLLVAAAMAGLIGVSGAGPGMRTPQVRSGCMRTDLTTFDCIVATPCLLLYSSTLLSCNVLSADALQELAGWAGSLAACFVLD